MRLMDTAALSFILLGIMTTIHQVSSSNQPNQDSNLANNNNYLEDEEVDIYQHPQPLRSNRDIPQRDTNGVLQYEINPIDRRLDFTQNILLTLQGIPNDLTNQHISDLQQQIVDIYNQINQETCGEDVDFLIDSATILVDAINSFGDEPRTLLGEIEYSYFVEITLSCDRCNPRTSILFESRDILLENYNSYYEAASRRNCKVFKQQFEAELQEWVSLNTIPVVIASVVEVENFRSTCPSLDDIDSSFAYETTLAVFGPLEMYTQSQVGYLRSAFVEAYNAVNMLNPNVCDMENKILDEVTVSVYDGDGMEVQVMDPLNGETGARSGGFNYFLYYSGFGNCFGCPSDGCLFDDTSNNSCDLRRQLHDGQQQQDILFVDRDLRARDVDSCWCTAQSEGRLPLNDEFVLKLQEVFDRLRETTDFVMVTEVGYAIQSGIPDTCCGFPLDGDPVDVDDMDFADAISKYFESPDESVFGSVLNCWDVSRVTDMSQAFASQDLTGEDLSCWDVSNVEFMNSMFTMATLPGLSVGLSAWDVSRVTDMSYMFQSTMTTGNLDIDGWDVARVTDMSYMFSYSDFNEDISNWDVSNVTNMRSMFFGAGPFNQDLCAWKDKVNAPLDTSMMLVESGCIDKGQPRPGVGPWCYSCDNADDEDDEGDSG